MIRPTPAEQIRASRRDTHVAPAPQTATINQDDENVRPEAWFAYVMPTQVGVELVGSGRYGFWRNRPDLSDEGDCISVGSENDEPMLIMPKAAVVSVLVAQAKHIEATPFPTVQTDDK